MGASYNNRSLDQKESEEDSPGMCHERRKDTTTFRFCSEIPDVM